MIINHNMSAINSNRVLKFKHWDVNKSMEKLSSGMRINRAGDDASGLAVSEKMRTQIQGLRQAERNTEDGMSFIQTTEGYLDQTSSIMQRIRVLAVQSSNGIYAQQDRQLIQVRPDERDAGVGLRGTHRQRDGLAGVKSDPGTTDARLECSLIHPMPPRAQDCVHRVMSKSRASRGSS